MRDDGPVTFDFDKVISRQGTASIADDGYRDFLLGEVDEPDLPATGADLLSMWVADMDIASPDVALDAIRSRLDQQILGYTLNSDEAYRQVFVDWCRRRYGWIVDPVHVRVGRGVVPALIDLIGILCDDGDKVVTLTPAYHFFEEAAEMNEIELVTCALIDDAAQATIDMGALADALADPAARVLLLCHPHNPNGREWTVDELQQIADLCRTNDVQIISDEIHGDLTRTGVQHRAFASVAPAEDRIITLLSPSKTFNLAGLLFSNTVIPDPEIAAAWDEVMLGITNPLSLAAATAVHRDGDEWLDALRRHIDDNFALVQQVIDERLPHARFAVPEATYLAWIDLGAHADGIDDLTAFFAREAHVLLEGPEKFVADAGRRIRLNVACPRPKLVTALEFMVAAIDRHSERD